MPSHPPADHAAPAPEGPGAVDALLRQTRSLRGRLEAASRDAVPEDPDEEGRWHRALYAFALRRLEEVGDELGQLRDGLKDPAAAGGRVPQQGAGPAAAPWEPWAPPAHRPAARPVRSGSAEWNLLTDEVRWSAESYRIFGRTAQDGPLTLDELPSWLHREDQEGLTALLTGCLVDGRPINGEFRIVRPDGSVRVVHMLGEAVPDPEGCTAALWAVLRDVSDLRRSRDLLRSTRESVERRRDTAATERRLAAQLRDSVLPPWREPLWFPPGDDRPALDLAAHYLPCGGTPLMGGDWYDAMHLPDGSTLLTVGDLTGTGVAATTQMAMLLGAVRGLALAGTQPEELLGRLDDLLDRAARPALAAALCCRYDPADRTLTWAQAGHPAPVVFRDGAGRVPDRPQGVLLGAAGGIRYGRRTERLAPGDVVVLHTAGLTARLPEACGGAGGTAALLALGPRLCAAPDAQEGVRVLADALGSPARDDDACVLLARIG